MLPTKRVLRSLVIIEVVLAILSLGLSFIEQRWLPDPLRTYLEAQWESEVTQADIALICLALRIGILLVVSLVGLFRFWRPARNLYMVSTIGSFIIVPILWPGSNYWH